MKQRQYTELQKEVMKIIEKLYRVVSPNNLTRVIKEIKEEYKIEEPYLTIRQYINLNSCGAYNTFHFKLNDKEISIDSLSDMLTDELCILYPLTNNYYVVNVKTEINDGNCENFHSDNYLSVELKED